MIGVLLERTEISEDGVFGFLTARKAAGVSLLRLYSMEDDWRDNAPRISCIPAGDYVCKRTIWYKRGIETFEVTGVANRSRILFHAANTEEDVEGCIGMGLRPGRLWIPKDEDTGAAAYKRAVVESQDAFRLFIRTMAGVDEFPLSVIWKVDGIT